MGDELADLQERLWAEGKAGGTARILLVLQGMDTSGKGGTLRHTVGLVDPQGVRITSFKAPTEEERAHDFLWRIRKALPGPGYIGVFDRSHYEDVLIARVRELRRADGDRAPLRRDQRLRARAGRRRAPRSSSACCTSPPTSRRSGCWPGSTTRPSTGSSTRATSTSASAVAGVPSGVRDRPGAHQHRARAVARDPGRPQVVPQPGHRPAAARGPARHGRCEWPEADFDVAEQRSGWSRRSPIR